jgi:hypothetical protein
MCLSIIRLPACLPTYLQSRTFKTIATTYIKLNTSGLYVYLQIVCLCAVIHLSTIRVSAYLLTNAYVVVILQSTIRLHSGYVIYYTYRLYVYLSAYLHAYLPTCLRTCTPTYLPTYLRTCTLTCLPVCVLARLLAYLPTRAYVPGYDNYVR